MSYSAKAVANYFLQKSFQTKRLIGPLKLQKLIYYAHGYYLAITDKPLINEPIQAWEYGPVIPSIYHEFKYYGNDPICELATEGNEEKNKFQHGKPPLPVPTDSEAIEIMDKVWESYSGLKTFQLSEMTHEEGSPWDQTRKQYGRAAKDVIIADERIKSYFLENELNVVS